MCVACVSVKESFVVCDGEPIVRRSQGESVNMSANRYACFKMPLVQGFWECQKLCTQDACMLAADPEEDDGHSVADRKRFCLRRSQMHDGDLRNASSEAGLWRGRAFHQWQELSEVFFSFFAWWGWRPEVIREVECRTLCPVMHDVTWHAWVQSWGITADVC